MSKKVLCLTLCLALLLIAMSFALGEEEASGQTRRLRLGSSMYSIEIDQSYNYGVVSAEEAEDGLVAYLYSDDILMDFDVYQFPMEGEAETLPEYVNQEAGTYDTLSEIVTDGEINGIPAGWYRTVEEYDDVAYETLTYIFSDGEDIVELVFWLDGENAGEEVASIVNSLEYENLAPVQLGSSPYWVFCNASFKEGGMTSEDVAEGQVAYWLSDETLLDFDVYQFSKEGLPGTLADYVAYEAGQYESIGELVPESVVNDIPVGWYRTVEAYDGVVYNTVTCVMDAGDEYVEIVFWLDGDEAASEADAILHSLWREEPEADGDEAEAVEAEAADAVDAIEEPVEEEAAWAEEEVDVGETAVEEVDAWLEEASEAIEDAVAGEQAMAWEDGDGAAVNSEAEEAWAREWIEDELEGAEGGFEDAEAWADEEAAAVEAWADEAFGEEFTGGEAVEEEAFAEEYAEAGALDEGVLEEEVVVEEVVEAAPAGATKTLRLGTSPFCMVVPASFTEGEMTQEDIEDDQVAYYYSNETLLDFDVYQFSKDGYPNVLADYTVEEAAGYNGVSELVLDGEINGMPACWYRTVEEYEEAEYNTITYILDDGEEYVEVVFWLDGDNADAEAAAIIQTLSRDGEAAAPEAGEELIPEEEAFAEAERTADEAVEAEPAEAGIEEEVGSEGADVVGDVNETAE